MFPDELAPDRDKTEIFDSASEPSSEGWRAVPSAATGYIQSANIDRLLRIAEERDLVLRMKEGAGGYAVEGAPLSFLADNGKA